MDRDAKMRGLERMKRLKIPERFRDYRVMLVELPGHADYDVIYDMPKRTVWVNAAARPGANVAAIEPEKT
jgi:hypothetical protein